MKVIFLMVIWLAFFDEGGDEDGEAEEGEGEEEDGFHDLCQMFSQPRSWIIL